MPPASAASVRARLRAAGRRVRFAAGEQLMVAGDPSSHVLLVESGLLKVLLLSADGPSFLAALIGPGELVGEQGVINQAPRSAQVTAVTPGAATRVACGEFLRLFRDDADVRGLVGAMTRKRHLRADERHLTLAREVPCRVVAILLAWAREYGSVESGGLRLRGPTRKDVALAIAASEKSVEAVCASLRARGLLRTARKTYLLPDPDALAELITGKSRATPDIRG